MVYSPRACYSGGPMRLLLVGLVPLLAGCFLLQWAEPLTLTSVSEWHELPRVDRPLDELSQMAHDLLARDGYKFADYRPGSHHLMTEWDVHLSSIFREGFRRKVEVFIQPVADKTFNIRIRSYREVNDDPKYPLMEDRASWMGATIDAKQGEKIPEPAIRLRQLMKYKLYGLER